VVHIALGVALAVTCWLPSAALATQPVSGLDAATSTGCCACRGSKNGEQSSLKSCNDGLTPAACQAKCDTLNAGSMVFGYQQTCSQGCAGFATQSLK
jgi:hypothetical protein